jgi:diguanylate cyclase (GGDEF)-like protein
MGLFIANKYFAKKTYKLAKKYYNYLIIVSIFQALLWVFVTFFLLYDEYIPNYQIFAMMLVVSTAIGALTTLSASLTLTSAYLAILLLPLGLSLFYHSSSLYNMVGGFFIVLFIYLISFAKKRVDYIVNAIDIKEENKKAHMRLSVNQVRLFNLMKDLEIGIFYYDENLIAQNSNKFLQHIFSISEERFHDFDLNKINNKHIIETLKDALEGENGIYEGYFDPDRKKHYIDLKTSPEYINDEIIGGIGIIHDLTGLRTIHEQLSHQALHDDLTSLPNRTFFVQKLDNMLYDQTQGMILLLDLDQFKYVNDTLGHNIGDELLVQISKRIVAVVKDDALVSRFGGDEFIMLCNEKGLDFKQLTKTIRKLFEEPFYVQDNEIMITPSIGAIGLPYKKATRNEILKYVDIAMYEAKGKGKNEAVLFDDKLYDQIKSKVNIINSLRNAISYDELRFCFQPKIEISTNKIVGLEALVRWIKPSGEIVRPEEFIPILESSNESIQIDELALKKSCQLLKSIQQHDLKLYESIKNISINISANHFRQTNFTTLIKSLISRYDIDYEKIELEITENSLVSNFDEVLAKMKDLQQFGISFSIDDFGTGYSSLSYIKNLPIESIKIDKSFIENIHSSPSNQAIVESTIYMSQKLHLKTIAEGIETKEELETLKQMKCDMFQGFLGAKPLEQNKVIEFLENYV